MASFCRLWPKQYASSCLIRGEGCGDSKAEEMASRAGAVRGVCGMRAAWCFREKRARNRWARGAEDEWRTRRSCSISERSSGSIEVVGKGGGVEWIFDGCGGKESDMAVGAISTGTLGGAGWFSRMSDEGL